MQQRSISERILDPFFEIDAFSPLAPQEFAAFFRFHGSNVQQVYSQLSEDSRLTATHIVSVPDPHGTYLRMHVCGFPQKSISSANRIYTVAMNPEYDWGEEGAPKFLQVEQQMKLNERRYLKVTTTPQPMEARFALLALDLYGPFSKNHANKIIEVLPEPLIEEPDEPQAKQLQENTKPPPQPKQPRKR